MAETSRVVVDGVVVVAVEKEDKTDDNEDRDNGKQVGNYCDASEKDCGCTLARCQSCFLTQGCKQGAHHDPSRKEYAFSFVGSFAEFRVVPVRRCVPVWV